MLRFVGLALGHFDESELIRMKELSHTKVTLTLQSIEWNTDAWSRPRQS